MPAKLPWMVAGRPISAVALLISLTASPREKPVVRLNESVMQGNWLWWVIDSGVADSLYWAMDESGIGSPDAVRT